MKRNAKDAHLWKRFEDSEDVRPSKKKLKNIEETSSESECSDDDCEICAICLRKLYKTRVGSPEGCDHNFCLKCIMEWSKNVNTCPIDRRPFQLIFARESIGDDTGMIINAKAKDNRPVAEENDVTLCEVCGLGDREDRMLLCDGCNKGYHLECLNPPLDEVPRGDWFCYDCETNPHLYQAGSNRIIPRTLIYQRVLRTIRTLNENQSSDDDSDESGEGNSSSDDDNDDEDNEEEDAVNPNIRPDVPQRKKKPPAKKKSSKRRRGSKRRRKRSGRRRRRSRRSFPDELRGPNSRAYFRSAFEKRSLSIFGHGMDRVVDEEPCSSTSGLQRSAASPAPSTSRATEGTSSFDILGDILNSQALLHSNSSDIAIGRDGRLKSLKPIPDMRLPTSKDRAQPSNSFFLRDICSPASLPSSVSSSSSPRSSPSLQAGVFPSSSSHSRFSDFSESSNDTSCCSYEESYKSVKLDSKIKKDAKSKTGDIKSVRDNLFDKAEEYSPVCDDDDDDDDCTNNLSSTTDYGSSLKKDSSNSTAGDKTSNETRVGRPSHQPSSPSQSTTPEAASQQDLVCDDKSTTKNQNFVLAVDDDDGGDGVERETKHEVIVACSGDESSGFGAIKSSNKSSEDEDSKMDVDYDEEEPLSNGHLKLPTEVTASNEEKAKKLAAVENLMREALKSYYQNNQISKQDYKIIMKKGVMKIMKSGDKRLDPGKVKKFVDQYVVAVLRQKSS